MNATNECSYLSCFLSCIQSIMPYDVERLDRSKRMSHKEKIFDALRRGDVAAVDEQIARLQAIAGSDCVLSLLQAAIWNPKAISFRCCYSEGSIPMARSSATTPLPMRAIPIVFRCCGFFVIVQRSLFILWNIRSRTRAHS